MESQENKPEVTVPFYTVICFDDIAANKINPYAKEFPHKVGNTMLCNKENPPQGFIRMPLNQPVDSIRGQYEDLYQALVKKGVAVFK